MNMSFSDLVLAASPVVQGVMLMLVFASISSWYVIFRKRALLGRQSRAAAKFEEMFWSGGRLADIYDALRRRKTSEEGLEALFRAGYEEIGRSQGSENSEATASVQRSLRVAQMREVDELESGLAYLATVGSTAPYVGLFGTVWGIMNAFIGLGNVQQATLAQVAPGIAEALIATAMGLVAAIPAVIAYNTFTNQVGRLESRFNAFSEEFLGIVDRHFRDGHTHGE
ncbi:MAG: protein TolQ [Oceanococcaceae bacterium]